MISHLIFLLTFVFFASGCFKPASENQSTSSRPAQNALNASKQTSESSVPLEGFVPFMVYGDKGSRENHYIPSGFMPDGKCLTFEDTWQESCHAGNTCIRIEYDIGCSQQGAKWAGIYWLNPANNWGGQKGGFDLTGASKLTFWAKGENGEERIEEFKIGGIMGEYPDSDTAVIGPVILTNEWQQYTIDLRGKDLSYLSGGFAWSTNIDFNPDKCVFYLDEIQYE